MEPRTNRDSRNGGCHISRRTPRVVEPSGWKLHVIAETKHEEIMTRFERASLKRRLLLVLGPAPTLDPAHPPVAHVAQSYINFPRFSKSKCESFSCISQLSGSSLNSASTNHIIFVPNWSGSPSSSAFDFIFLLKAPRRGMLLVLTLNIAMFLLDKKLNVFFRKVDWYNNTHFSFITFIIPAF